MQIIYVITAGGTIDQGNSESSGGSKIEQYLKLLRLPHCDLRVISMASKDSVGMTNEDFTQDYRVRFADEVAFLLPEENPIVIWHSTDTLIETGLFLQREFVDLEVPVILTGAMCHLGSEASTCNLRLATSHCVPDALQNFTESLMAAQLLGPGVYVMMHGQVFPVNRVRLDRELVSFVPTIEILGPPGIPEE